MSTTVKGVAATVHERRNALSEAADGGNAQSPKMPSAGGFNPLTGFAGAPPEGEHLAVSDIGSRERQAGSEKLALGLLRRHDTL